MDLVRKRRSTVLIHRIGFVVQSRVQRDIWTSRPINRLGERPCDCRGTSHRGTSEKVRFTAVASNRRDASPASAKSPTQSVTFEASPQVGRECNRAVLDNKVHPSAVAVMTSRAQGE